jgi:hypothetical protein
VAWLGVHIKLPQGHGLLFYIRASTKLTVGTDQALVTVGCYFCYSGHATCSGFSTHLVDSVHVAMQGDGLILDYQFCWRSINNSPGLASVEAVQPFRTPSLLCVLTTAPICVAALNAMDAIVYQLCVCVSYY